MFLSSTRFPDRKVSLMSLKRYVDSRKTAGLCINCGKRQPKEECVTCTHCLVAKDKTQCDLRAERRERGLCLCGRARAPYRRSCFRCLLKNRARSAAQRHARKTQTQKLG